MNGCWEQEPADRPSFEEVIFLKMSYFKNRL